MTNAAWRSANCLFLAAVISACAPSKDILVQLETHRPEAYDPHQVEVQATVLGPQSALRYKWFSVNGDFDPQESYEPKTQFTFAAHAGRDRIWVEVWRDNEKVAESALDVNADTRVRLTVDKSAAPELTITHVPRYQAEGGPDTRDTIAGTVRAPSAADYKVIVYARADAWYIQPTPFAMQAIGVDNTWKTWTHTGSSYAALVVRSNYKPMTRLDVLPQIDPDVLARAIVDGRK
jgi:hypothetical protein